MPTASATTACAWPRCFLNDRKRSDITFDMTDAVTKAARPWVGASNGWVVG